MHRLDLRQHAWTEPLLAANPRARGRRLAGAQRSLIAISSPVGMDALDPDAAHELIGAHRDGLLALGDEVGAWLDAMAPAGVA